MRRAVEASGARPSQSGKEASCALAHTWKRRWIHSEDFYKNRTKTRASVSSTRQGKLLLPREGQGPMEKPLERRG